MTRMYGVPEDYKVYMYTAFGMMLAGVVAFVVFLIIGIAALVSASVIAIGCGFTIAAVMGFAFLRKKKKDTNADFNITILIRILLLLAFAVSTYLIVFSGFYITESDPFSTNMLITLVITLPIVIISLIACDIFLSRKRNEKESSS